MTHIAPIAANPSRFVTMMVAVMKKTNYTTSAVMSAKRCLPTKQQSFTGYLRGDNGEIWLKFKESELITTHWGDTQHNCDGICMRHEYSCCEDVWLEDICGDLEDLVNATILTFEEITEDATEKLNRESATWTFYRIQTNKGEVVLRWCGTSNGYYSENVDVFWTSEEYEGDIACEYHNSEDK